MILGVDVSTYPEELAHGARYYDGDRCIDPLDAFLRNGVDWMRIRVWNDPFDADGTPYLAGTCTLEQYLQLAAVAKQKGFHLFLDLHYSDFWADPGKQCIPKAWQGMDAAALAEAVYAFTADVLEQAKGNGVAPEWIQIGNEITNGMLWPIGKLADGDGGRENYETLAALLKAGVRACREQLPEAKIVLHLERSNDAAVYREFFTEMQEHGVDYDCIAASYYPYWHGTFDELFRNLNECRIFQKERIIAELGYGFTDRPYQLNGTEQRLVIDSERAYVPGFTEQYPLTPQGQAAFVRDFLREAEQNGIDGVFYWEPLWLPGEGICWASEAAQRYIGEEGKSTANEWANQCLFDYSGQKLPAFDQFSKSV